MQLGSILKQQGLIDDATLDSALQLQARWGSKLGDILLATRSISPPTWLAALGAQFPSVSLHTSPPDTSLLTSADIPHYITHNILPHRTDGDTLVIATPHPSDTLRHWCESHYARPCRLVLMTTREHRHFLQQQFGDHLTHEARQHLKQQHPQFSAFHPLDPRQGSGLLKCVAALMVALSIAPYTTWYAIIMAVGLFYFVTLAFKALLLLSIPPRLRRHALWQERAAQMTEQDLPIYSILVPLYREPAKVIQQNLAAIDTLDYPKTKLDVWLILEADDTDTYTALCKAAPPDYCRILRVPASAPRTKPKACNVALPLLEGEFCTIYDAEDIPDPGQLKLAVAAFRASHPRIACLQAPLNYYNRRENLLTRFFSIEYSALFRLYLPALRLLGIPIPLGGTSNHLRVSTLRAIGGWDPYNVTEDADLGIRMRYFGHYTDLLPSLTLEESPISLRAWLNQRSRWIKGYIQTWLVFMRHPLALLSRLGPIGFLGFQLFVGAPAITFLFAPFFWLVSFVLLMEAAPALTLPNWLLACCGATFLIGIILQWITGYIAIKREGWGHMPIALALYPFYWILHSLACLKALWQLAWRPHFWEKTNHGKSARFHPTLIS